MFCFYLFLDEEEEEWKFPDGFDSEKYKKMTKMGLPEHVIRHKMASDGFKDQVDVLFDVCILGKDPPKPEPEGIVSFCVHFSFLFCLNIRMFFF